jgi:hypothetical protein
MQIRKGVVRSRFVNETPRLAQLKVTENKANVDKILGVCLAL